MMRIGELSKRTSVSIRMLRYYESEGLLQPPRTAAGYREYGPAEAEIVQRIRLLGSAGLTLGTIQQLLPCVHSNQGAFEPCDDLRAILNKQVGLIDERIGALNQSRDILAGFLSTVTVDDRAPGRTK